MPTISVVIPCYNGSAFLRETLDSALAQTYPALEVLVIDDGSTDDSAAIAESYGAPVRVIRQENQGESVARNRGIDEAQGEWVAFLDADDLWEPEKLARQAAAVRENPDVVCVHTGGYSFGERTGEWPKPRFPAETRYGIVEMCMGLPIRISSAMTRKSLATRYPTWTRYGEELIYFLELSKLGRIVMVEEPLAGYRCHAQSQSHHPRIISLWMQSLEQWVERQNPNASDIERRQMQEALNQSHNYAHFCLAFELRQQGQYLRAAQEYFGVLRRGGRTKDALVALAKLIPHRIGRVFGLTHNVAPTITVSGKPSAS